MTFDIPILFLGYNRDDLFKKTLSRIIQINPQNLYISLDGPSLNKSNDFDNCQKVRDLAHSIVLPSCNIHLRVSKINLGCKEAVKSAIDWFFTEVEFGIIIEDDCFPSISFFSFCEEMLKKYSNDDRISQISGTNFQYGIWRGVGSYYFSNYTHVWGWATWRRAWLDYDVSMKYFESARVFKEKRKNLPFSLMKNVYEGKIDTWDIQWFYTNILHGRLTIVPNINLVKNLGFGNGATHTTGKIFSYIKLTPTGDLILPIKHTRSVKVNRQADKLVSIKVFGNKPNMVFKDQYILLHLYFYKFISFIKFTIFSKRFLRFHNG